RHAAVRASAELPAAVLRPALLPLPRWLRHRQVPVPATGVPRPRRGAGHHRGIHAPVETGHLCQANRGPCPVRAGSSMPGVSRMPAARGREEPALIAAPGLATGITAVVVAVTAGVFAAVGDHGTLASIQRLDDAWLKLMISGRTAPLTAIAKVF